MRNSAYDSIYSKLSWVDHSKTKRNEKYESLKVRKFEKVKSNHDVRFVTECNMDNLPEDQQRNDESPPSSPEPEGAAGFAQDLGDIAGGDFTQLVLRIYLF